jgi:hypothetical protein
MASRAPHLNRSTALAMSHTLRCDIIGSDTLFTVKIDLFQPVFELQEITQLLAPFDLDHLMLYKVDIDISKEDTYNKAIKSIAQREPQPVRCPDIRQDGSMWSPGILASYKVPIYRSGRAVHSGKCNGDSPSSSVRTPFLSAWPSRASIFRVWLDIV